MLSPQVGVRVSGFSLSCRRRSMCRSGGREVGIFFPLTPSEEHVSLRGSGVG